MFVTYLKEVNFYSFRSQSHLLEVFSSDSNMRVVHLGVFKVPMLLVVQYVYSILWRTIFLKVLARIYAIVINERSIY